jgi:hypothetical protein
MVSFEFLAIILTGIGLIASILYYTFTLQNANKTRQTQLFMQIYQQANTEESNIAWAELVNIETLDYEEYLRKYDSTVNPAHYAKRSQLWFRYDTWGELLRLNIIEPELLHRLGGYRAIVMWEKWGHIIKKNRERENMPDLWEGFEYMYNEMKKLRESKGYSDITYNP